MIRMFLELHLSFQLFKHIDPFCKQEWLVMRIPNDSYKNRIGILQGSIASVVYK